MSDNLFADLSQLRCQEVPVAFQSSTRYPNPDYNPEDKHSPPYFSLPTPGTKPLEFLIHPITANEINDAEALITAIPPNIFEDQPSPTGRGMVSVLKGPNYEDATYQKERAKQIPKREAAICLYGCKALAETTPGATFPEKVDLLVDKLPAAILEWMAAEIGSISMLTAVGAEQVASFLASGSGNTDTKNSKNSSNSSARSQTPKKRKSSTSSTARTSNANKGKRRTTGG